MAPAKKFDLVNAGGLINKVLGRVIQHLYPAVEKFRVLHIDKIETKGLLGVTPFLDPAKVVFPKRSK